MNVNDDNFTNADDQVWERHEIPDEYHYKLSKNSPPILVLAQPKTIILSSSRDVQRPVPPGETDFILLQEYHKFTVSGQCKEKQRRKNHHGRRQSHYRGLSRLFEQTRMGMSGYDPDHDDMKGIFMAKGPGNARFLTVTSKKKLPALVYGH